MSNRKISICFVSLRKTKTEVLWLFFKSKLSLFSLLLLSSNLFPLLGHCESSKCLTTEGKLAWRIGSAWHSKSGTKNFAKFFFFSPSMPPASSLCLPLCPTLSHSLISSLEISLRRLSAGKLVTSAALRQQLFPPH